MTTTTRPRVREDSAVRRTQLIDETIRLVGRHGYHGFTIQALAEQCGISNAGVLHYYPSKDKLFLAVLDEIARREDKSIAPFAAAAKPGPGADTYSAAMILFRAMMERVVARPEQARFVIALQLESTDPSHPAHAWFRSREKASIALFTQLAESQGSQASATSRHLLAVMYGLVMQWLRSGKAFDLVVEWERAARIALPRLPRAAPISTHGTAPATASARNAKNTGLVK